MDESEMDNMPYGSRIIGGRAAKIEDFPYIASLEHHGKHRCCLNVITASWLVAAAQCVIDVKAKNLLLDAETFNVVAGATFLTTNETRRCDENQVRRRVKRFLLPPEYTTETIMIKDVALVAVSSPLPLSDQIKPAPLPQRPMDPTRDLPAGRRCYVAGWGATKPPQNVTRSALSPFMGMCIAAQRVHILPVLQKVTLPLVPIEQCLKLKPWLKSFLDPSLHICTLSREGKDACTGDAGGPLVCNGIVVAIVSWGKGCAEVDNPSVYTRIDPYLKWLDDVTDYTRKNEASHPPSVFALGQLAVALAVPAMHGAFRGQLSQSVLTL